MALVYIAFRGWMSEGKEVVAVEQSEEVARAALHATWGRCDFKYIEVWEPGEKAVRQVIHVFRRGCSCERCLRC
jgi:hypothetical protein